MMGFVRKFAVSLGMLALSINAAPAYAQSATVAPTRDEIQRQRHPFTGMPVTIKSFATENSEGEKQTYIAVEDAKAYLRTRGKYVIDKGNTWQFSHTVRWDEYKKLAQHYQRQAA